MIAQSKEFSSIEQISNIPSNILNSSDSLKRKLVHQYCIFNNLEGLKQLIELQGNQSLFYSDIYNTNCSHFAGIFLN